MIILVFRYLWSEVRTFIRKVFINDLKAFGMELIVSSVLVADVAPINNDGPPLAFAVSSS